MSAVASLRTRATRDGDTWRVYGNKTWITHPVRADIMTFMVRTKPDEPGYKGLSILIGEKPRGSETDPFPGRRAHRRRDRSARLSRLEGIRARL